MATAGERVARDDEGVTCPFCKGPLEHETLISGTVRCPHCGNEFRAVRFSPPQRNVRVVELAATGPEGGHPCANHPGNAAVVNCDRCGAFICGLCQIDADGMSLCPACFDRLSAEGALESSRTKFRDFGGLASTSAAAGCLVYFLCVLFGPLAIYYGIKGLRQKKALGESEGIAGIWVAMALGLLETAAGVAFIGFMIVGLSQ